MKSCLKMKSRRIVLLIYVPAVDSPKMNQLNQNNRCYSPSMPPTFREVYGRRLTFPDCWVCFPAKYYQTATAFQKPAGTVVCPETIAVRELLGAGKATRLSEA